MPQRTRRIYTQLMIPTVRLKLQNSIIQSKKSAATKCSPSKGESAKTLPKVITVPQLKSHKSTKCVRSPTPKGKPKGVCQANGVLGTSPPQ